MGIMHNHVVTLVRDFCALNRPSTIKKTQLQDLLMEYQNCLSPDDLKTICSLFAQNNNVPKPLIIALCHHSASICHPLLLASSMLTNDDLIEIIDAKGLEHARIIARRSNIDPKLRFHLREQNDERIDRALELRQMPLPVEGSVSPAFKNIRVHQINSALDEEFVQLTKESDISFIHTALVDNLSLEFVSVRNLCSNFTSRNLPIALHYLRLSTQTAWLVFVSLAHETNLSDDVHAQFVKTYENLDYSISVATVKSWQQDDLRARKIYSNVANQSRSELIKKTAS